VTREIFLVAAVAANGTIGADGAMPWHIPADLRRFKSLTMGQGGLGLPMVMGRKTFDSLPGLLPGRRHIVLTRDQQWQAEGAEVAHSFERAMDMANAAHVAVIGGAEIYALALPTATRCELTQVRAEFPGDTLMPPLGEGWREIFREEHAAEADRPGFAWLTLKRDL
jgi:dihydrofolate reductase